jgi:hypothetical protein
MPKRTMAVILWTRVTMVSFRVLHTVWFWRSVGGRKPKLDRHGYKAAKVFNTCDHIDIKGVICRFAKAVIVLEAVIVTVEASSPFELAATATVRFRSYFLPVQRFCSVGFSSKLPIGSTISQQRLTYFQLLPSSTWRLLPFYRVSQLIPGRII